MLKYLEAAWFCGLLKFPGYQEVFMGGLETIHKSIDLEVVEAITVIYPWSHMLGGGLSSTALCQRMRWLVLQSKLCTVLLRPLPY